MEAVDEVTDKDGTRREDIEMKERNKEAENDRRERSERDRERRDRYGEGSRLNIDDSNEKVFTVVDDEEAENTDRYMEERLKKLRSNEGVKEYVIHNKKQFLEDGLGITTNKGDGPNSTKLYDNIRTTFSKGNKNINGATYRGKKILILGADGKMKYSISEKMKPYVNEFKELLKRANTEHRGTAASVAERYTGVTLSEESTRGITDNVQTKVGARIDEKANDIKTNTNLSENELREFRGILKTKVGSPEAGEGEVDIETTKIDGLKIDSKMWRDKAKEEGDTDKGRLYEAIAEVADLKADEIRLALNMKPETEEVIDMLEETAEVSDMTRFERFKRWSRENLLGLSSVAIGAASILTTVIMATRNTLAAGGDSLDKFRKAVVKKIKQLAKKLGDNIGPIVSAVGSIISGIIAILAKLLGFLGENLWLLFLAVTYFVYSEYKSRRETRAYRQQ